MEATIERLIREVEYYNTLIEMGDESAVAARDATHEALNEILGKARKMGA